MHTEIDELENKYVAVYKELLVQLDRLFLLQNGTNVDNEMESRSRLRALHQINVSETASLLNMKDSANDTKKQVTQLLENKYERDGQLRVVIENHWALVKEWLEQAHETERLRQNLVEISSMFPKANESSVPDPKNIQTLEMLQSIYSVLVVQGGYQDIAFSDQ
ncbi:unnamed protein product [Kluyveromyces dobzhanskii CBS 2104]|uniref:WGS project CCBQ000000000 data, contig 00106 n=1 Tax=Kluyveromyces dobzhanskii CBS 2104 TaxID=1427455 RepID=A0A0A8L895_9SACH|nr:unnamed protein product [Kluyveromyces dobzhanskii CBS 2104]